MMKINIKDTDSLFQKDFAKYLFNSEKNKSGKFNQIFHFRLIPLFWKKLLRFFIFKDSNFV